MFEFLAKGLIGTSLPQTLQMLLICVIGVAAIGYLLGCLNFGIILSKVIYHDDIRNHGSKNAGVTDMLHTYGKKAAALTFAGDAAKALIATFIGTLVLGDFLAGGYIGGLFCVIGHVFPVFYKFKGGKGMVASAMVILFTNPFVFLIVLIFFLLIVLSTKYISLGSVMGMLLYPLVLNGYMSVMLQPPDHRLFIAILLAAFTIWLHRANVKKLLDREEEKVSLNLKFGKKKKDKE